MRAKESHIHGVTTDETRWLNGDGAIEVKLSFDAVAKYFFYIFASAS